MKNKTISPMIKNYKNYRQFMRDFYLYKKNQRSSFSYRQFALRVGVKSPNYLQLVIQGKRNLSTHLASQVARAMTLNRIEELYFVAMVRITNSKGELEREQSLRDILVATKSLIEKNIPHAQSQLLRGWQHLVVRELVCLPDFVPDGAWISKALRHLISTEEAEKTFANLIKADMIRFENNGWIQSDPVITTGLAFDEELITSHHVDSLKLWSKNLTSFSEKERELGLLNIPIHPKNIPEFQQKIRDFQSEIIGWLKDEKEPQQVVQLGVYLMPISKNPELKQ